MNIVGSLKTSFNNYANFSDRSGRMEYWTFVIALIILSPIIQFIDGFIQGFTGDTTFGKSEMPWISLAVGLLLFIPHLAIAVRRLHDLGKSGWWYLISLTGIGIFVLLYWFLHPSEKGENAYGAAPLPIE